MSKNHLESSKKNHLKLHRNLTQLHGLICLYTIEAKFHAILAALFATTFLQELTERTYVFPRANDEWALFSRVLKFTLLWKKNKNNSLSFDFRKSNFLKTPVWLTHLDHSPGPNQKRNFYQKKFLTFTKKKKQFYTLEEKFSYTFSKRFLTPVCKKKKTNFANENNFS